jgi:hypothetical protein
METAIVILIILCLMVLVALAYACRITITMIDRLVDALNRLEGALAQKGIQIW